MPRFNPNNYDPNSDSSPGAPKSANLVLVYDKDGLTCRCGCGQTPKNPKRSFVQGHDARLKGALVRAAATDTKVEIREGKGAPQTITAMAAAKAFGWDGIIGKAKAAYADKAKAQAERAKAADARKVKALEAKAKKVLAAEARKAATEKAAKAKKANVTKVAAKKATAKKAAARKATKATKATPAPKIDHSVAPPVDPPVLSIVEGTEVSA